MVLSRKINGTILRQVVEAQRLALLHRVKDRRLALVVHKVRVAARLDQFLHDLHVALPRGIKQCRLIVGVAVIGRAPIFQEKFHEVDAAVA